VRKQQLKEKAAKVFFTKTGRIPAEHEVMVPDSDNLYKPTAEIIVPEPSAVSNPEAHRTTAEGLIEDFKDLNEAIKHSISKIHQLNTAINSESSAVESAIQFHHRRLRRLASLQEAKDVHVYDLPVPDLSKSNNITYNNIITLAAISSSGVDKEVTVLPYSNGDTLDYTPTRNLKLPSDLFIKSNGTESGFEITLTIDQQTVTGLQIDFSPCIVKIFKEDASGNRTLILRKHIERRSDLKLENLETNKLVIRVFQYQAESRYSIRALNVIGELYPGYGRYTSMPVEADLFGPIRFYMEHYTPVASEVVFYYGTDRDVTGHFSYDPDSGEGKIAYLGGDTTKLSKIARYPHIYGAPYA
jgi:hypothetical protein